MAIYCMMKLIPADGSFILLNVLRHIMSFNQRILWGQLCLKPMIAISIAITNGFGKYATHLLTR